MNSKKKDLGPVIGGQAVMEGVMMRHKNNVAIAVRKPSKKITIKKKTINSWQNKCKFFKLPFVRGVYSLFESLVVGLGALTYSANESIDKEEEKISNKEIAITMLVAFVFAIGLFVLLPFFLSTLIVKENFLFNVLDGVIRIIIFFLYIVIISRIKDIKTVFQYHGAEHKAVHTYEAGKKLTVKNAKGYSPLHPRCGTSFLLIVLFVSIVVFSFILSDAWVVKLLGRVILLPVIAGVAYEILKISAKYNRNIFFRMLTVPGLTLQRLTTAEPDDEQLKVALKSLSVVLDMEDNKK